MPRRFSRIQFSSEWDYVGVYCRRSEDQRSFMEAAIG